MALWRTRRSGRTRPRQTYSDCQQEVKVHFPFKGRTESAARRNWRRSKRRACTTLTSRFSGCEVQAEPCHASLSVSTGAGCHSPSTVAAMEKRPGAAVPQRVLQPGRFRACSGLFADELKTQPAETARPTTLTNPFSRSRDQVVAGSNLIAQRRSEGYFRATDTQSGRFDTNVSPEPAFGDRSSANYRPSPVVSSDVCP